MVILGVQINVLVKVEPKKKCSKNVAIDPPEVELCTCVPCFKSLAQVWAKHPISRCLPGLESIVKVEFLKKAVGGGEDRSKTGE